MIIVVGLTLDARRGQPHCVECNRRLQQICVSSGNREGAARPDDAC